MASYGAHEATASHQTTTRVAGALVLLFCLQLQRIRHLTAGQVTEKDGNAYLTAGRRPILLPPRLGVILGELAAQPPPRLTIPSGPQTPRWLFPGHIPRPAVGPPQPQARSVDLVAVSLRDRLTRAETVP